MDYSGFQRTRDVFAPCLFIGVGDTEDALKRTTRMFECGRYWIRTSDLCRVKAAL